MSQRDVSNAQICDRARELATLFISVTRTQTSASAAHFSAFHFVSLDFILGTSVCFILFGAAPFHLISIHCVAFYSPSFHFISLHGFHFTSLHSGSFASVHYIDFPVTAFRFASLQGVAFHVILFLFLSLHCIVFVFRSISLDPISSQFVPLYFVSFPFTALHFVRGECGVGTGILLLRSPGINPVVSTVAVSISLDCTVSHSTD
jgi:hypothetical protein